LCAYNRKYRNQIETLNATVARQRNTLLTALQDGLRVYGQERIKRFFHQKYINNEFIIMADRIVWDSGTTMGSSAEGEIDWSLRRMWTLRQVYSASYMVVIHVSMLYFILKLLNYLLLLLSKARRKVDSKDSGSREVIQEI